MKYRIRYRPEGTSAWTKKTAGNNFKVLNNLLAGTTYQYQVRTVCGGGRSPWSSLNTFTTDGDGGCTDMGISIIFDDYSNETSWGLVDESGAVVASGGNYGNYLEGEVASDDWCLDGNAFRNVSSKKSVKRANAIKKSRKRQR